MSLTKSFRGPWAAVAVCAAVFGVLSYLQPYWQDTLWFWADYHGICDEMGGPSVRAFWEYFRYEAAVDNARVFNRMAPLIAYYLPKWLDGGLVGCMTALLFWSMGKLIGLRRDDGPLWWGLLGVMFVCLPWNNNILVPVYSLNYIYPAACSMAAVYLALQRGVWSAGGAVVLAVLGAWGHEGIGGTLLAGAVPMMLLVGRFDRYRTLYAASATATATAMVAFFFTNLLRRFGFETARAWMDFDTTGWLMFNFFTVGLVVFLAGCMCRRRWRLWLLEFVSEHPMAVYFFSLAVAGAILSGMMQRSYRITFWPQLCAMVVWGMVLLGSMRRYIKSIRWCVGGLVGLCAVLFAGEVWVSAQFRRTYDEACRELDRPGCSTAYIKLLHPRHFPRWFSRFTPRYMFIDYSQALFLRKVKSCEAAIVPKELRGIDTSIPTDSIVMAGGGVGYFRPSQPIKIAFNIIGDVTTASGVHRDEPISLINFVADDGTPLIWVQPMRFKPEEVIDVESDLSLIYTYYYFEHGLK